MIVRLEPWGAWVKLESMAAIAAIDRDAARALGIDGAAVWSDAAPADAKHSDAKHSGGRRLEAPPSDDAPAEKRSEATPSTRLMSTAPLEVHMAVTSRCAAGCEGCYLDARPDGEEPPREILEARLDALRDAGVFTVAFGGGEPTLRDDLGALARAARARGLTPIVTTSGLGLGPRKIEHLAEFAQVNVSYDGPGEAYEAVRGFDGSAAAENAIARLSAANVTVGVNVVLTRATFDAVRETVRRAIELGATEVQLLRYKPQGRARSLDYLERRLTLEQARRLGPLVRELSSEHEGRARIRVDCALVPFLSADEELSRRPAELARFGVLGCEAGDLLGAARIDGGVAPCSFLPPTPLDVTSLARGWARDAELEELRARASSPVEPCVSCTLSAICKGGCKVVSGYENGSLGPDPECPRVRAHHARSA